MTEPVHVFHRWISPTHRGSVESSHRIEATEAERMSLAAWLDVPRVESLTADLIIRRRSADVSTATGTFQAVVELICGVSLEPFVQTISGPVDARFRKPLGMTSRHEHAEAAEIDVDLDEDEPGEWLPQGVDLGAHLAEEVSLALPDFPRKPDAEFESDAVAETPDETPNPFAALVRLKESGESGL